MDAISAIVMKIRAYFNGVPFYLKGAFFISCSMHRFCNPSKIKVPIFISQPC